MADNRPDLTNLDPHIRAYIESLEAEIERLTRSGSEQPELPAAQPAPVEPPGPLNVITVTASGIAKRTPPISTPASAGAGWEFSTSTAPTMSRPPFYAWQRIARLFC